ncbi:hypothetical protein PIB30_019951 [Stylosanthes scabra]|uniref:Uncharacterized protein n=1 Tax=Stylosanthes scabra TaxID=79078 RepID=A0ABU6XA52_9FABA|nr:hypothetical protein [Stylosanthes scabra]
MDVVEPFDLVKLCNDLAKSNGWEMVMAFNRFYLRCVIVWFNRETDENGKPVVVVGENYSWIKGEVRDLSSLFLDMESVE